MASEDRLSVPTHTSFAAAAIAEQSAIYEYTGWISTAANHGEWDGRMQFMASSKTKHKHCLT